jgi:hypothetical protein
MKKYETVTGHLAWFLTGRFYTQVNAYASIRIWDIAKTSIIGRPWNHNPLVKEVAWKENYFIVQVFIIAVIAWHVLCLCLPLS